MTWFLNCIFSLDVWWVTVQHLKTPKFIFLATYFFSCWFVLSVASVVSRRFTCVYVSVLSSKHWVAMRAPMQIYSQSSMWMTEISPKNPKRWACCVTIGKSSKVLKSVKLDVYFSGVGFFICAHSHIKFLWQSLRHIVKTCESKSIDVSKGHFPPVLLLFCPVLMKCRMSQELHMYYYNSSFSSNPPDPHVSYHYWKETTGSEQVQFMACSCPYHSHFNSSGQE